MTTQIITLPSELGGQGLLLLLVAAAVMLVVVGAAGLLGGRDPVEQRFAAGVSRGADRRAAAVSVRRSGNGRALKALTPYLGPLNPEETTRVRERLVRAGYRGPDAVRVYYISRVVLGFGAAIVTAVLLALLARRIGPLGLVGFPVAAGLLGYCLPLYWVTRQAVMRKEQVRDSFPDALDMLLVCVEAGHGLDQALARVAADLGAAHPVLAEELAIVGDELRIGKERALALRDLARRTGVEDIQAFVTVLVQSDQYGTSIGDALRVYAARCARSG
jgi:tight adherence protein C